MRRTFEALRRPTSLPLMVTAVALLSAACGGAVEPPPEVATIGPAPEASIEATSDGGDSLGAGASEPVTYDFATGEPVLVAVGYTHPNDRVDNTGAYLPTNGKPTLVFVDAIW